MKNEVRVFCPGTVSNVSCGFDVLGFCLDHIGDEMLVRKTAKKGISITKIEGFDLPYEVDKNVAAVSAIALLEDYKADFGFEIEIFKKIKPGSGIGSSAASAAGSVVAINELLNRPYTNHELTQFAMKGESVASKSEHADNLAPAIFGGFTLVKSMRPLEILQLPLPEELFAVVIHPQIEIRTAEARAILPKKIPMTDAVLQWANLSSFIHALHTSNYELMSRSVEDAVVEPYRSGFMPYFDDLKRASIKAGALGFGISGSGPSMFALTRGKNIALAVKDAMDEKPYNTSTNLDHYLS